MRITYICRKAWPSQGGMEEYLRLLARGLGEHGHDVRILAERIDGGPIRPEIDVFLRRDSWEAFGDGPVRVEPLRVAPGRRAMLAPVLARRVRRLKRSGATVPAARLYGRIVGPEIAQRARDADVLHMWGGDVTASAVARAAELLGRPSVMTPQAHAGQWDDDPGSADAYRRADRVVASSRADADLYASLGVARERIAISPPCVEPVAPGDASLARGALGLPGPLVLFLGVRRPHKGVELLAQAAHRVAERRPDVTFAFVGPGPELPSPNGLGERLRDVGRVDQTEKAAWLQAADLVCLPSAKESFGLVVAEAWSARTPVLVSD